MNESGYSLSLKGIIGKTLIDIWYERVHLMFTLVLF